VSKFPAGYGALLASSKWKERKETLDEILAVLKAALRIAPAPELGELAKTWATMVQKDANVMCVAAAAGCIEALARGLGAPFARYREAVVAPLLERLKERKANITDAIGLALDATFTQSSLADVLPDIQAAAGNKNPQVKEGTLKFLARCLATSPAPVPPGEVRPLAEQLAALMEDSFEGARNEAAHCLGTLMRMVGERPLGAVMDGLADVRKAKVKEAFEKATVKAKAGAAGPPKPAPKAAPAAAPAKAAPKPKAAPKAAPPPPVEDAGGLDAFEEEKPVRKPPARLAVGLAQAAFGVPLTDRRPRSRQQPQQPLPPRRPPQQHPRRRRRRPRPGARAASPRRPSRRASSTRSSTSTRPRTPRASSRT
jgi:cytoskeleton-associated protein 5